MEGKNVTLEEHQVREIKKLLDDYYNQILDKYMPAQYIERRDEIKLDKIKKIEQWLDNKKEIKN